MKKSSTYINKKNIKLLSQHLFMAVIMIFMLFPLIWAMLTAFKPKELVNSYPPVFISKEYELGNFAYIFKSGNVSTLFKNTIVYSLTATLISIVCASLSAYALSRYNFKGKKLINVLILCPMLIPGITNLIPLYNIYGKLGWINTVHGLILLYLPALLSLPIVILRNYMSNIPVTLEESAMIDGCNRIQILSKIVLPILTPGMLSLFLINFITVWNDFLLTLVFTNSADKQTLTLELFKIAQLPTIHNGITNATAITSLLPVLIMFLLFRKQFIGSMLEGAVKG